MVVRIIKGDVREKLAELPADYFDCVVTSPPYYALRDYGCAGQIGLEPTLDAWLETMVAVCRELRRVLKPSGVLFCNIGDGYKDKNLMLVPERLGIALQADGWWVRSHIIWAKKNPMPESCTDRPTSAHETIWMLTKSSRYYWDAEAAKEPNSIVEAIRRRKNSKIEVGNKREPGDGVHSSKYSTEWIDGGRNLRNVWHMASQPFPDAHFATFPTELAERCIKAGSSERGCCHACGKPWVRVTEKVDTGKTQTTGAGWDTGEGSHGTIHRNGRQKGETNPIMASVTTGWYPSCKCDGLSDLPKYPPKPIDESERGAWIKACAIVRSERSRLCDVAALVVSDPAIILDPFAGAGTTGLVADRLGRDCTLIDLNTEYAEMALKRIKNDCPMFAEVAAE